MQIETGHEYSNVQLVLTHRTIARARARENVIRFLPCDVTAVEIVLARGARSRSRRIFLRHDSRLDRYTPHASVRAGNAARNANDDVESRKWRRICDILSIVSSKQVAVLFQFTCSLHNSQCCVDWMYQMHRGTAGWWRLFNFFAKLKNEFFLSSCIYF